MPSTGYIQVHAYASFAQLPLENVSVSITATDGTVLALRLTDRSGLIKPVPIPTPPVSDSQSPDPDAFPFTTVNLHARLQGYDQVQANNLQVFPGTITRQELPMVPLSELPAQWDKTQQFDTPPQNL